MIGSRFTRSATSPCARHCRSSSPSPDRLHLPLSLGVRFRKVVGQALERAPHPFRLRRQTWLFAAIHVDSIGARTAVADHPRRIHCVSTFYSIRHRRSGGSENCRILARSPGFVSAGAVCAEKAGPVLRPPPLHARGRRDAAASKARTAWRNCRHDENAVSASAPDEKRRTALRAASRSGGGARDRGMLRHVAEREPHGTGVQHRAETGALSGRSWP